MASDQVVMTREGYDKLKLNLDHMQNVEMIEVAKRIATAREMGDLSENAEYHAAREDQGMLKARIDSLKDKLANAFIVDKSTLPTDQVVFGSKVKVYDVKFKETEEFELVGPGEEDYDNNKILASSPMGQAMMGKKIGDNFEVQAPAGVLKYQIKGIK
ncbi:MAG TPA: transcription elongation factor GreA [Gemmatales bacterium]|nr:transcription elongation factor GreA [Gemmatales bacterium]